MLLNTKILQEFIQNIDGKYTGSFIAKKHKLNQKTVSNYLFKLEQEHILKSKIDGKNKLYFLNLQNLEIIKHFIILTEHMRTIDFYKQNPLIKEVFEKILQNINGICLIFGSYAKNLQKKNSHLDILIIGNCDETSIEEISQRYNLDISLKIYPKFENDILMKEVIQNHILIKNVELFVEELLNEQN